jgi:hypothetical protein
VRVWHRRILGRTELLGSRLGNTPPSCLDSRKQVAVGFRFDSGPESILQPAQSPDDRLHTKTLTGKLSTNLSKASSLSRSRPGRQRSKRTISMSVPFGQSVLLHSAFSKLGSRSKQVKTMRSTFRGLLPAPAVKNIHPSRSDRSQFILRDGHRLRTALPEILETRCRHF